MRRNSITAGSSPNVRSTASFQNVKGAVLRTPQGIRAQPDFDNLRNVLDKSLSEGNIFDYLRNMKFV